MKITFIYVGKTDAEYLKTGISLYEKRLVHYTSYRSVEIPALKNVSALSEEQIKEREGLEILKNVKDGEELILLDERGVRRSSVDFAAFIEQRRVAATKSIVFAVGGAYGFSSKVYERATGLLSLSDMTFSHQMVRLIFVEQLYRAFTIIKGEPYHHK